ncbi:14840_t:CDS:2, partial [Cetraspora pellucida]
TSHIQFKCLENWRHSQVNINHGLVTWTNIHWYSAYNNVKSIFLHKSGFRQLLNHNEARQPKIELDHKIIRIIENKNHWKDNEIIMKILEPVNNTIKNLEFANGILIDNLYTYWKHISSPKYAALVIFVKCILALVPHAAETERCFSTLGYHNTKYHNNIKTSTLKIIELKYELETFFEEEQTELEDFTNLAPKFVIEQFIDINDPIFYNQTIQTNFIDESLVIDKENNDSD